jgi:basic membrane lipoprotein Med (substrate-binding protein (PBP1-ABC) superfamily)
VIGVDQDEYLTTFKQGRARGADKILSSAMKRVDNAVYGAVQRAAEGSFKGGTYVFDASNDGIGLAPFHEAEATIPEAVQTRLQEIAAALRTGKIKIEKSGN